MKRIFWLFLIVLINSAHAQWLVNFSLNHAYDNNPFRMPEAYESWISTFNMGIQYNFKPFSISYIGGFTRFDQIMERNFYLHQLALFGTHGNTNWGVYADQRLNGEAYELYDYITYTAFLNHRLKIWDLNFFFDSHAYLNKYAQFNDIDNLEFSGGIRLNKSFLTTRTTFIIGGTLVFKRYLSTTETLTEVINDGMGRGNGPGSGTGSYLIYSEMEAPSASQIVAVSRIAQSISASTGIAAQYQKRIMVSGASRFVSGLNDGYSEESQIFDDPIGYESDAVGGEFTQLLPVGLYLKGAFYFTEKKYTTQGIYIDTEIYDDTILRSDTYKTAWVRLQKSIPLNFPTNGSMTIRLIYQWLDNSSNSYWYNYENQYMALDLEFQF
jgi:hypothetical protein